MPRSAAEWLRSLADEEEGRRAAARRRQLERERREEWTARQAAIERSIRERAAAAPAGRRARTALQLWEPRLRWIEQNQQRQLARTPPGAAFHRQQASLSETRARLQRLQSAAGREQERAAAAQQRKALQARQAREAAGEQWIEAREAAAPAGMRRQASAAVRTPLLRQRQRELRGQAARSRTGSREYWEAVRDFWSAEAEVTRLAVEAAKERDGVIRAAVAATGEAARRAAAGQQSEDRFTETQRKRQSRIERERHALAVDQTRSDPRLTPEQKSARLRKLEMQELRRLEQPAPGEDELARLQRLRAAEALRARLQQPALPGSPRREVDLLDGGRLKLQQTPVGREGGRGGRGGSSADGGAQPPLIAIGSLIGELHLEGDPRALLDRLLRDGETRRRLHAEIDRRLAELVRQAAPGPRGR